MAEYGILDFRFRNILAELGVKLDSEPYPAYKSRFVRFYDEYPRQFSDFVKKSKDELIRRRLFQWAEYYGVPKLYIEAAYNILHKEHFGITRTSEIKKFAEKLISSGINHNEVVDRLQEEFNITRTYARGLIRQLTGFRVRKEKRDLESKYRKLVKSIVEKGYKLDGVIHSEYRAAVLEFYKESPKGFWDFFEMDRDTIIAYRPAELSKILGAKDNRALLGLFKLRFGKSWMEVRTERINRELANWLSGRYSRKKIVDILVNEYGLKRGSVKTYLANARSLV